MNKELRDCLGYWQSQLKSAIENNNDNAAYHRIKQIISEINEIMEDWEQ